MLNEFNRGVFFMVKKIAYPVEVKEEAIKMKLEGKTTSEIMNKLNIRNKTQVKTCWKWHRIGESYRFSQDVGKQSINTHGNQPLLSSGASEKYPLYFILNF